MIVVADDPSIDRAVELLRSGGLVAIPTETVYGLAADAADRAAVARIFAAKGRPADHPLIVHLGVGAELDEWAVEVPDDARRLAEAFWPGPLTMILPRRPTVLDAVTGGLDTVALRTPDHPVALAVLERFGGGLAAPSANRFGRVSPTSAADVDADLGDDVDLILDGGTCSVGVESTIVTWIDGTLTLVRPGGIPAEALAEYLGGPLASPGEAPVRAPGTLASHYAPATPLELCLPSELVDVVAVRAASGARVGTISLHPVATAAVRSWQAEGGLALLARSLYRWLREADRSDLDLVVAALPPEGGLGTAVRDRLVRAAHREKTEHDLPPR